MKNLTTQISQYFSDLPDQLRKIRLLVWLVFIITSIVLFIGMTTIESNSTVESWFDKDDPVFSAYNAYHAQFGSEDDLLVVYKAKDGNVFSKKSLEAVSGIRDELFYHRTESNGEGKSALDHIVRVDSLINASIMTAEDDLLVSRPLVGDTVPDSKHELEQIRKTAQVQKDIPLKYFSEDLQYGAIIVKTDFGAIPCEYDEAAAENLDTSNVDIEKMMSEGAHATPEESPCFKPTDMRDYEDLNAAVKEVLNKPEYADHFEYYLAGNTAESEYQKRQQQEMALLYLAALIIMVILLWFFFRSLSAVAWAMTIVIMTTVWTMGISGFIGLTVTPLIVLTAFLLLTVSMADAIHLMSSYLFFRRQGYDHRQAVRYGYKKASVACLLTTVTTMIGMGALCFSDVIPVVQVGFMGALGVAIAFILTMYFLPVALDIWSPVPKRRADPDEKHGVFGRIFPNFSGLVQKGLGRIVPLVEKRPIVFIAPFLLVLFVCVYGVFQAKVDSSILAMYQENSKFPQSIKIIDEKMAGSSQMAIYMDFGSRGAVQDPFVMKILDNLQKGFERKYSDYVVTTSSIVDIVKDTYQKLNGGREDKYTIPDDQRVLAQTLYMFNNADPGKRKRLVDSNYKKANVTVSLVDAGSYEYNDVFSNMQDDIQRSLDKIKEKYPNATMSITGMFVLKMKLEEYLTRTALHSFGVAFIVINIVFIFIFGSFKVGMISVIPNIIPSILVAGLMGLLNIPLDFFAIMLAPIIIGISVDDTIHFLTHYRLHYMADRNIRQAVTRTLQEAGQGVIFTSLTIGLGFLVLGTSFTPGVAKMGTFGALAVFVGLLNDLFLLPALIMLLKLKTDSFEEAESDDHLTYIQRAET